MGTKDWRYDLVTWASKADPSRLKRIVGNEDRQLIGGVAA